MIIDKMKTLDHLTIQEKYLVDYIINNQEDILKKNINELAKLSYTSSATISRLCKKLGFNGYKEFKYQYAADVRMNLESVLRVRIGSLTQREMGDIFDVKKSTFRPEEWIEKSAVMELASLGTAPTNFMMLMLLTLIREVLGLKPYLPDLANDNKPRHVIFLEEAHNLIANTSVQTAGSIDPKIAATAFIKDKFMLLNCNRQNAKEMQELAAQIKK